MSNPLHTFLSILHDKGLIPSEIIADGQLHRCPTQDKPYKQNGAYIAHLDAPATLWWCNWESAEQDTFTEAGEQTFSPTEKEAMRRRQATMKQQREAEFAERRATATQKGQGILNASVPCSPEHPYLRRKGVPALAEIRQSAASWKRLKAILPPSATSLRWWLWTWATSFPCPYPNGGYFCRRSSRHKA